MGVKLIERRTNGCTLTPAGEAFLASAERIETEMLRAQASLSGFDVALEGEVRVGAPDGFGTYILARHLGALMDRHPGLTIQLVPLPRAFSLAKREADMAVTIEPPQEGRLSVRKLTDYRLSFYAITGLCGRPCATRVTRRSRRPPHRHVCPRPVVHARARLPRRSRRAR